MSIASYHVLIMINRSIMIPNKLFIFMDGFLELLGLTALPSVCSALDMPWLSALLLLLHCLLPPSLLPLALLFAALLLSVSRRSRHLCSPTLALSHFRAHLVCLTSLAILAVDCPALFPARLAKSEVFGCTFMDLGVGAYVFSMGLSLKRLPPRFSVLRSLLRALDASAVLWVLGVGRAVLVHVIGYHQPVTEYGTHWNFFLTLAVLRLFAPIVQFAAQRLSLFALLLLGVAVLMAHQFVLLAPGVTQWLFDAPRLNLLSHNREGIISSLGYLGVLVLSIPVSRAHSDSNRQMVGLLSVIFFLSAFGCEFLLQPASRRLANAAFAFYSCGFSSFSLLLFSLLSPGSFPSSLLSSAFLGASRSMLSLFLIANLMTGFVNITLHPQRFSVAACIVLLVTYYACLLFWPLVSNRLNVLVRKAEQAAQNNN